MSTNLKELEKRLWQAADNLRANSTLSSFEYSTPVLGLIFLRYAWHRFKPLHEKMEKESSSRVTIGPDHYKAEGVLYLPEEARYDYLLALPEGEDIGQKVNEAMEAIERENPELADVLPKEYKRFDDPVLKDLLKNFSNVGTDVEGDVFGQIYEYFLGQFAMNEGQKGGEFFTPTSIVKLIVEVLEPYGGKILDPACGSGGMFVQSEKFRQRHRDQAEKNLSIYGQENKENTVRLCKMNLAVHGLEGDIKAGNTYYENLHDCVGRFDYVMANPPFNVSGVDKEVIEGDERYPFGIPSTDNANYLWMQEFYSALNERGRAGFVMANSAGDARHSEKEIRKEMIREGVVDVIISIGSNFFYTVTLPCTLWFFDKGKKGTDRENEVLFIDARNIYRQIDRAHRDFTPDQIEFISSIVRRYRNEEKVHFEVAAEPDTDYEANGSSVTQPNNMDKLFDDGEYQDIPGLCKVATVEDIEEQGWSLNPGRYVGVQKDELDLDDFNEQMKSLSKELRDLNEQARELEKIIDQNIETILGDVANGQE
ncbi:type I restriction-modification system subunit M [Fodinibius sp. SL11]|uniref:class I SAM-dependent DNA methyltransferase n=1 Tax=Fodinibius sp. SL11 TaxID=3425690 RepID=UPI003F885F5F